MKKLTFVIVAAAVLMLGLCDETKAERIVKVDLSTTTGPKTGLTNWNYLMPNASIGSGSVIDANGSVVSGLSVSVNGSGAANDSKTLNWPGFGNDPYYVPAAYDLIYALGPGVGLLGTDNELNVSFSGLDVAKTYNLRMYFLINENLANFDAAVSQPSGASMVRNNNINRVAVFSQNYLDPRLIFTNVAPSAGGSLVASVGASGNFQAVSLEAIVLEEVAALPEPSTYAMALAGIACGGLSMWRRRKRA